MKPDAGPAAARALVDAAGREVEEVVDHHLRDRERLGVRALGVDERHLFEAEDVAGLLGRAHAVGLERHLVGVVDVGQGVDLGRVERQQALLAWAAGAATSRIDATASTAGGSLRIPLLLRKLQRGCEKAYRR